MACGSPEKDKVFSLHPLDGSLTHQVFASSSLPLHVLNNLIYLVGILFLSGKTGFFMFLYCKIKHVGCKVFEKSREVHRRKLLSPIILPLRHSEITIIF